MSILNFVKQALQKAAQTTAEHETETVRKITSALDLIEPKQAKFIACFAYILSRVARADLNISSEELSKMEQIVMSTGRLPEQQAVLVVQMAKRQSILFGSTENFLVTREFNEIASREEKLALLECLYQVASADKSISTVEDNEISQIADEIRIEHDDLIAIRSRFRAFLAVLKDSRDLSK
jgi:uncharacterized tellurite resistance protein B-like protein